MSADTLDIPGLGAPSDTEWETVVGLEVHAELATETKLFSASPNQFGGEPNTHIDPVSLRFARIASRAQRKGGGVGHPGGPGPQLPGPAVDLRPQELFLPGHAQGLSDQPIRPAHQR